MKLTDLDEAELTAFMALLKQVIRADGELSETEVDHLASLGDALGEDKWRSVFDSVKGKYKTKAELVELAKMVVRSDARLLIHRTLSSVATSDAMQPEEAEILDALCTLWSLPKPRGPRRRRSLIK